MRRELTSNVEQELYGTCFKYSKSGDCHITFKVNPY